jgi:hypothetical protein
VRAFVVAVVLSATMVSVGGCGLVSKDTASRDSGQPRAQASAKAAESAAPAYLGKPKVGECHALTVKDIRGASETKKPVPCSEPHTTVTVAVVQATKATTSAKGDARTFAVGEACGPGFTKALGSDSKTRAKTLYSLAWFNPTKGQKAKGAKWLRCDVTLTAANHAFSIKGKQPLLDDGPTKAELACGRLAGGEKAAWIFVPCSTKHQFVLTDLIAAAPGTSYTDAEKAAKKACLLKGGLYSWSHADQWGIGDRWYSCWESTEPIAQDPGVLALGRLG